MQLALNFPEARLLPPDPAGRAQALRGLVFVATNCYAAIGVIDFPDRWTTATDDPARHAVRAAGLQRLYLAWDVFADSFPAQPYLSGAVPGALDFLALTVSLWSHAREHLRASRPALAAALQRIQEHERVAPVFQAHWSPAP